MNRFRPLYIAALAVMLLGLLGAPIIGKSTPSSLPPFQASTPMPLVTKPVSHQSQWKFVLALFGTGALSLAGLLTLAGPRS